VSDTSDALDDAIKDYENKLFEAELQAKERIGSSTIEKSKDK